MKNAPKCVFEMLNLVKNGKDDSENGKYLIKSLFKTVIRTWPKFLKIPQINFDIDSEKVWIAIKFFLISNFLRFFVILKISKAVYPACTPVYE